MRRSIVFLLILTLSVPATACLWDYDTLQMERERFPGALELIVGKFLRHSEPFYEWRVEDRRADIAAHDAGEKKLSDEQLARTYDDLAVALDKLKRHDEAIEVIREKAERLPNVGQYETHANLGTFLAHSGRLEEGVAELKQAIEIDPEAHFGREKYQVLLIEYVLEKRGTSEVVEFPLNDDAEARSTSAGGPFATWLLRRQGLDTVTDANAVVEELKKALEGVLGMMRFGDYRSPALLEVAGDLLLASENFGTEGSGQRLAARAYLRAAELVDRDEAKTAYREMAKYALMFQHSDSESGEREAASEDDGMGLSLASLEDQLAREVHEADDWFERTIAHDEELWVVAHDDPDAAFWKKYGGQEIRVGHDRLPAGKFASQGLPLAAKIALGTVFVVTFLGVVVLIFWRRKRPTGYDPHPEQPV